MHATNPGFRSDRGAIIFVAIVASVGCPGCGRVTRTTPVETFPTEVTVVLDGSPIAGAGVFFAPVGNGYAAYGVTDNRGIATLTTFAQGDGVARGAYLVRLSKDETTRNPAVTLPDAETDSDGYEKAFAKMVAQGKSPFQVRNVMPDKYKAYDTSGLRADISPGSKNSFVFTVTSTPDE